MLLDFCNTWDIKLDKNLCEKFIKRNFHNNFYLCYCMIYSVSNQIDLLRYLFLYKFGGCYFDISIKLINNEFLQLLDEFEFISSRDEDADLLQNGILFIKHKKSIICEKLLLEILSGVINYNTNTFNKKSFIYNVNPTHDGFFYGPTLLYKIYEDVKDNVNCKLLNTYFSKKILIIL